MQTLSSVMPLSPSADATQLCEAILREDINYNIEHAILPSEIAVARRLLGRRTELRDAYAELHGKLQHVPRALQAFFGLVLSTAAFWNPQEIAQARAARDELVKVNRAICAHASELAQLLQQRSDIQNTSGFSTETHYHVLGVTIAAAAENYLFDSYVRPTLDALRSQFDLKYWPDLSTCLQVIADDAAKAAPQALDPQTAAATSASRASLADFVKALFAAIEENGAHNHGPLPPAFRVTDSTLASLVNCSLDLAPEDLVDSTYLKRLRQRERTDGGRR